MQRCAIRREPDSHADQGRVAEPERRADGNSFSNDLTRICETELLDGQQVTIAVAG